MPLVLIVEDEKDLAELLQFNLRQAGFETITARDGEEGLGYLLTQWPKLIRYVEDPRLAIDTNLAENAIRPFALGRRYPRSIIMEGLDRRVA